MTLELPNIYVVSTAAGIILIMIILAKHYKPAYKTIQWLSFSFSFVGLLAIAQGALAWWASEASRRQVMKRNIDNALQSEIASSTASILSSDMFLGVALLVLLPLAIGLLYSFLKTLARKQSIKSRRSSSKTIVKP